VKRERQRVFADGRERTTATEDHRNDMEPDLGERVDRAEGLYGARPADEVDLPANTGRAHQLGELGRAQRRADLGGRALGQRARGQDEDRLPPLTTASQLARNSGSP